MTILTSPAETSPMEKLEDISSRLEDISLRLEDILPIRRNKSQSDKLHTGDSDQ